MITEICSKTNQRTETVESHSPNRITENDAIRDTSCLTLRLHLQVWHSHRKIINTVIIFSLPLAIYPHVTLKSPGPNLASNVMLCGPSELDMCMFVWVAVTINLIFNISLCIRPSPRNLANGNINNKLQRNKWNKYHLLIAHKTWLT